MIIQRTNVYEDPAKLDIHSLLAKVPIQFILLYSDERPLVVIGNLTL